MDCKLLFEKIDKLEGKYIQTLKDACDIESLTRDKAGVDEAGRFFIEKAKELGFKIEVYPQEKAGDVVVITMNENSKEAPVAISGHIDTVHPKGRFGYPPTREEGDRLIGPGVSDCKGGVVAGLFAMEALKEVGYTKRPVMLLLQTDEEVGSSLSNLATINYICERSKNAVAFLNLEGANPGLICLERKGILVYKLKVKGIAKHSSSCDQGASAIAEACHKILKLEEFKDPEAITCNCGVIKGGTVSNSVAEYCEFTVDFRYSTDKEREMAEKFVYEVANNNTIKGCSCEVEVVSSRPAMEKSERNYKLAEFINEVYAKEGLPILKPCKRLGGSDAAYTSKYLPTVDNLGTEGGEIHTEKEYIEKASLVRSAKRIASVLFHI